MSRKNRDRMTPDKWLYNIATKLRPWFREAGYVLPGNIEFRCGFTKSRNALGQYWPTGEGQKAPRPLANLTADLHPDERRPYYIFIDPSVTDSVEAAAVLT